MNLVFGGVDSWDVLWQLVRTQWRKEIALPLPGQDQDVHMNGIPVVSSEGNHVAITSTAGHVYGLSTRDWMHEHNKIPHD